MSRFDRNWTWRDPDRTLELAGRCASLMLAIAGLANVLLWWVAFDPGWFQFIICAGSGLAALGMLTRVRWPINRLSEEATWLACMVWVAQTVEILLADGVRWESKIRLGGIFFALAFGSFSVFVVERIALSNAEPVTLVPVPVEKTE